jgi:hypothetical protein
VLAVAFHGIDSEGEVRLVHDFEQCFGGPVAFEMGSGQGPAPHRGDDLPEWRGLVRFDLPVAFHDHRQCGRLHASDGEPGVVDEAVGAGGVHVDQPVGLRADHGRVSESTVVAFGFHGGQCLADGLFLKGGHPQAARGLVDAGMVDDAAEDGLALAVRVACVDQQVHVVAVQQPGDDLVLPGRAFFRSAKSTESASKPPSHRTFALILVYPKKARRTWETHWESREAQCLRKWWGELVGQSQT